MEKRTEQERESIIAFLHVLWEKIKPNGIDEETGHAGAKDLYDGLSEDLLFYLRRGDGSRMLQTVFRRADEELREKMLSDVTPHLAAVMRGKYCCNFFQVLARLVDMEKLLALVKPHAMELIGAKIGLRSLDFLWQEGKGRDRQGIRSWYEGVTREMLLKACEKGGAAFELVQSLIDALADAQLGDFFIYVLGGRWQDGFVGCKVGIRVARASSASQITGALALATPQVISDVITAEYIWRPLVCAICKLCDPTAVQQYVLPPLVANWGRVIKVGGGLKFTLRLLEVQPSVFGGIEFAPRIDPTIAATASEAISSMVCENAAELAVCPDGSKIVVAVLCRLGPVSALANMMVTQDWLLDKVRHKAVRRAVDASKDFAERVRLAIARIGLVEVLQTPAAWVCEALARGNPLFREEVLQAVVANEISGKAVEAIVHPRPYDGQRSPRLSAKRKAKS